MTVKHVIITLYLAVVLCMIVVFEESNLKTLIERVFFSEWAVMFLWSTWRLKTMQVFQHETNENLISSQFLMSVIIIG